MPKKCDFCKESAHSGRSVFDVTEDIADYLNIKQEKRSDYKYICQEHFGQEKLSLGPKRKKLKAGALPNIFPHAMSVMHEHDYAKAEDSYQKQNEDLSNQNNEAVEEESSLGFARSSKVSLWEPTDEDLQDVQEENENTDGNTEEEEEENDTAFQEFEFAIVSMSMLISILSVCRNPGCGAPVDREDMEITRNGCILNFKLECHKGCREMFTMSEELPGKGRRGRKVGEINVMMSALLLLCGLAFEPAKRFFKALNIPFISKDSHYRYLKNLLYPVIYTYWLVHQSCVLEELRQLVRDAEELSEAINIAVSGDCRFDTPGFRAMYATHYTVSLNTSKVLTVVVVNKRQTGNNSPAMEPAATRASLTFLQESKVRVDTYVTDRSSSVRSLLRDEFGWIKHQGCYQINFLIITNTE